MGFLKDIHTLKKMGNEASKDFDVKDRMEQASARMAEANTAMQQMAGRAGSQTALTGTPGTANVISATPTGQYINMQPMVRLELLVTAPGRTPMPVTVTELMSPVHLARIAPGTTVAVKVGATPDDLFVDWDAPR